MNNVPRLRFKADDGSEFSEWETKKLGVFMEERRTQAPKSDTYPLMAFIAYKGVAEKGDRYNREFLVNDESGKKYKQTEYGDFIYSSNNLEVGSIGLNTYGNASISPVYSIFKIKEKFNEKFISNYLVRPEFLNKMVRYRQGVVYGQWRIHEKDFLKIEERIPSWDEQNKIAAFLTAVDTKIEQLSQKEALLKQYKKGVMQKIFSQEIRFKADDGSEFPEWEEKVLGQFLIKHSEKTTTNNQYPVLTSSRKGLFLQSEYFAGKDVASKDNTGYNVVPRGYFTYRHMSDDVTFKVNINNIVDRGIVSTLYPVFTTKGINDQFLQMKLNEGSEFPKYAMMQKQGGSRTYMYFNKLEKLILCMPCLSEQNRITEFLNSLEAKIDSVSCELATTKTFKKGLLQQMFV